MALAANLPSAAGNTERRTLPLGVADQLGYYVYRLVDPADGKTFYVGKGVGERMLAHLNDALASPSSSDRLDRIRVIRERGEKVLHVIHRHGMEESTAQEVEAALIDAYGVSDLTNLVLGYDSAVRGPRDLEEIIAQYAAQPLHLDEPAILITINKEFERGLSDGELYEKTRKRWVLNPARAKKVTYALAVFRGIVREVYRPAVWSEADTIDSSPKASARWQFEGQVAQDRRDWIGRSVLQYVGGQNPIRYVNC